jgi:CTP synthase
MNLSNSFKKNSKVKFVFVTGGVVSSLGKGVAAASCGLILEKMGFKISFVKCDPYLNIDPGTMNPNQHGEVFVTFDGCETDLDLGHYERFTEVRTTKNSSITSGRIYLSLLEKERIGVFLGQTVQTIPHLTNEIKNSIYANIAEDTDFVICEIGGTVGDIEASPFLEAIRQIGYEFGSQNVCYIHMTLVPYLKAAGELKTKPTQHSVRELRSIGIQPSILLCRSEYNLSDENRIKIASFCNMKFESVIPALDNSNIYEIPLKFCEYGFDRVLCEVFGIQKPQENYLDSWKNLIQIMKACENIVKIGLICKYVDVNDSYKSVFEALKHAGIKANSKVIYKIIDSNHITNENVNEILSGFDGLMVLGGFGNSGISGKIEAIKFARENKIPFFGICLGMQLVLIEAARNLLGLKDADSTEFNQETKNPIIVKMNEWIGLNKTKEERVNEGNLGGTMRIGAYECVLKPGSLAHKIYGAERIFERHRHRYEVNNQYLQMFEDCGFVFSGVSAFENLMEIVEIPSHPFFIAVQFHPEFQSSILKGHPIFNEFVKFILSRKINDC